MLGKWREVKSPGGVDGKRTSTPGPSYMSPDQVADFLSDLRTNRPVRPGGARPLPTRNTTESPSRRNRLSQVSNAPQEKPAVGHKEALEGVETPEPRQVKRPPPAAEAPPEAPCSSDNLPRLPHVSLHSEGGRRENAVFGQEAQRFDIPYYETGQRWTEKQETKDLRAALEDMDSRPDRKIHEAAEKEAARLVWQHQNPGAAYKNPSLPAGKDQKRPIYKEHLRKGSHSRSQNVGPFETLHVKKNGGSETSGSRSSSGGTSSGQSEKSNPGTATSRYSNGHERIKSSISDLTKSRKKLFDSSISGRFSARRSRHQESFEDISSASGAAELVESAQAEKAKSAPSSQPTAPHDLPMALRINPKGTFSGNKSFAGVWSGDRNARLPAIPSDIEYRVNPLPPTPPDSGNSTDADAEKGLKMKDGMEVRSDDIRDATSRKRRDRSPNLPMPIFVSDDSSRPIVSFDEHWKPKEEKEGTPTRAAMANALRETGFPEDHTGGSKKGVPVPVPVLALPDSPPVETSEVEAEPPVIVIEPDSVPSICVGNNDENKKPAVQGEPIRPLPRPQPRAIANGGAQSRNEWKSLHVSPAAPLRPGQAQCMACGLPISGRIVGAAGHRFHPQCFSCFHCGELLECVAFYPEPENARSERLAGGDADTTPRFYCHLDFHERFSPRCKNCKTPIEGEVIVACGAEWHAGHFFCAECGDPFDQKTPFVERNGYAWCVGCHTKKFSGKCAGCRQPVMDTVLRALDREWHEDCFRCRECGDRFEDGRFFVRGDGQDPFCVACEERRLKNIA